MTTKPFADAARGADRPGSGLGPCRLLIAGEEALSRGLIEMVLSRLGYVVSCVADADEALAAHARTRFALALLATRLPGLSGLELARRMQTMPHATVPIMLFGEAGDAEAMTAACSEAGLAGFLPKPISIGRLVSSVCGIVHTARPAWSIPMSAPGGDTLLLERVREFTDGDPQLERELVSLFLATAGRYLDELRGQLGSPDAWRLTAHALKGASANIGARRLAALATMAERDGPMQERLAALDDALDAVRSLCRDRWAAA